MSTPKRLFGLDVLRALAISLVLLSHTLPEGFAGSWMRSCKAAIGFLGVEIFFVLSGYLIGGILLQGLFATGFQTWQELTGFWKRRWFRTVPNYLLFLILNLLLQKLARWPVPPDAWKFAVFSQALVQEHPGFFPEAWSLAVEEWFYLLFPALLLVLRCARIDRVQALLCCIALFLVVPALLRWEIRFGGFDSGIRKVTLFRLDSLMFGVLLALVDRTRPALWELLRRAWPLGLMLVGGMIALLPEPGGSPGPVVGRLVIFTVLPLGVGLVLPAVAGLKPGDGAITQWIGRISLWSYSLYLCHRPVMIVNERFFMYVLKIQGPTREIAEFAFSWAAFLLLASWLYRWFERPLMELRERPLFSSLRSPGG